MHSPLIIRFQAFTMKIMLKILLPVLISVVHVSCNLRPIARFADCGKSTAL